MALNMHVNNAPSRFYRITNLSYTAEDNLAKPSSWLRTWGAGHKLIHNIIRGLNLTALELMGVFNTLVMTTGIAVMVRLEWKDCQVCRLL